MPFRPQTEKLKALHLQMHDCGRLCSDKPGAVCKRCGPDTETKTCKRGHSRNAEVKRCAQCDKDRRETKLEAERARNAEAAAERAAHRAGLGLYRQG